jgi:hypothetical protein
MSNEVKKKLVLVISAALYLRILEFAYLSASLPTQMHPIKDES